MFLSRNDLVKCPSCDGDGRLYCDFGHSSIRCTTCKGLKQITREESIRRDARNLGYGGQELEDYVNDYFGRN